MHLKLSSFEKSLFEETSVFSGYSQSTVREVYEFGFIRGIENYFSNKKIKIPFLGEVQIEYKGDKIIEGNREAILETTFIPSPLLIRVIGEAEDGDNELIQDLLEQKLKPVLSNIITEE